MTTVRIKQEFHDKDRFSVIYPVGSVQKFEDARAEMLISKGLAELISKEPSEVDDKPRRGRKSID